MPEPLYRALGLTGAVCIVAGRGTDSVMARTDQWLGREPTSGDPAAPRAELVRRFLRCYGPSTAQRFAEWTGRSPRDERTAFELVADELDEVEEGWILRRDRRTFEVPPSPTAVRFLPALDPYLQQRDRTTVLPDERARKRLWQPVRGPGGVLADGEIVGVWRGRIQKARLEIAVESFGPLSRRVRGDLKAEADRVALARGQETAGVTVPDG